jgi:hypothetical protein
MSARTLSSTEHRVMILSGSSGGFNPFIRSARHGIFLSHNFFDKVTAGFPRQLWRGFFTYTGQGKTRYRICFLIFWKIDDLVFYRKIIGNLRTSK